MAKFPPDERTVYLAFKNVFKGPDGNTRSEKKIKKKIQKHENQSDEIRALVHEHNIDNVGNSVKALLEGDVFASTLKAKMRFPELFDVSPAQSAERAASEAEAVRTEMDAMRDANVTHQDQSVLQSAERAASEITAVKTEIDANRDVSVTQQKHNLPTVVDGEAVVKKEQPHIHVSNIRKQLKLETFETFAALLCDENCARQLSRLRRETHSVVEEFGRNKDLLEVRFMDRRKEIAARRAELDRVEIAAWEAMLEEDKQYQCFAGMSLEEMVDVPGTAFHSRANSEADETSEEETSVESEGELDFHRVAKEPQDPIAIHIVKPDIPLL
ncbi:hypothetical protein N0V91_000342 [Didymella pomorum]|uniref:Uncharacterized protein n=1 Tax=Didymella pomorum TaxID=749634 RepID=A0A9W8ZMC7_9PLEO|nr:hypothetical protein N0V91_000342 [Didymella pomorum]